MEGSGGKSELKKPATALKKVGSFRAESETQTAVAVRVPSFNQKEATEAAERIVTDEQAHSASMARKRRLMTKNRAQGVRTREKTPEPSKTSIAHEDTTTTDEDDAKSPRSQSEKEADDIYAEMRRKLQEKNNDKDNDDLDIDALREAKVEEAKERRRRSISPFALPTKEEIARLQRKGSFIDPGNKLLSTIPTYAITPKDEIDSDSRRDSLVRDEGLVRRDSLINPPSPNSPGQQTSPFQLTTPPSPRKPERPVSASERSAISAQKATNQPKTQSIKQSPVTSKPKQSSLKQSTNINTSIVNRPQDPIQKITSVNPTAGNTNAVQTQKSDPSNAPPVKPKRSKSGTRSQGRTSESEMSEDQSKNKIEPQKPPKPKERRRTIAAIKRSVRERSPAKRSQSATRADQPLDVTGIELTKAGSEIIDLLEKARRRSISIPDEDLKLNNADNMAVDKSRQLMTPNKTPSTPKKAGLKITSPKKIEILSQEEMMESFKQAQRKSMEIERSRRSSGYIDASQSEITSSCYSSSYSEDESDFDITKRSAELTRKLTLLQHEKESTQTKEKKQTEKKKPPIEEPENLMAIAEAEAKMSAVRVMFRNARRVWKVFKVEQKPDYDKIKAMRNRCFNDLIIVLIFCGVGGFIFRYTEGAFENFYKCGVRRVKRDFIDSLWQGSHNMREDDWKSMARKKLWEFESQLHTAHEAGVHSYSGQKSWSFLNSVVYCLTVITTIGYGHIAPSTTTGRAITIVYAVFGIPLFLILLADFGKLFTRCIKFLWAFVRRLYYTGSCRKVRKTVQVQEVMKGLNMVYEAASTFRRPSQYNIDDPEALEEPPPPKLPPKPQSPKPQTPSSGLLNIPPIFKKQTSEESAIEMDPQTPAPSVFEIDDEFNLPISVAITCLIIYILMGASIYVVWEDWGFFESFYFVFISMSTIGFGDFVPNHPMYMMGSIIYLVFGMALTSMCINVVQVKLSDSFRQASAKIGATIGLRVSEEDGSMAPITPVPVEIPAVHVTAKPQENNAPVAV